MKKMLVLFTFITISVLAAEPITAHTPSPITTDHNDLIVENFNVKVLPGGAYLTIAGKFGGEITKSELTKVTSLEIQGCAAGAKIFQFVLVVKKERKSQSFKGDSGILTKEMHMQLQALTKGDEFSFKDVKAHLNSNTVVDVWAKKFVII